MRMEISDLILWLLVESDEKKNKSNNSVGFFPTIKF